MTNVLTGKQRRFLEEQLIDLSAARAFLAAAVPPSMRKLRAWLTKRERTWCKASRPSAALVFLSFKNPKVCRSH